MLAPMAKTITLVAEVTVMAMPASCRVRPITWSGLRPSTSPRFHQVVVTRNDHKHVVNTDAEQEEPNDGVHGTEDEAESRADAIAGEKAQKAAADPDR